MKPVRIVNSVGDTARVDFRALLTWTNLAGRTKSEEAALHAKLARAAGSWHVVEVSADGKLP